MLLAISRVFFEDRTIVASGSRMRVWMRSIRSGRRAFALLRLPLLCWWSASLGWRQLCCSEEISSSELESIGDLDEDSYSHVHRGTFDPLQCAQVYVSSFRESLLGHSPSQTRFSDVCSNALQDFCEIGIIHTRGDTANWLDE